LTSFLICIFILSTAGEAFRPANSAAIAAYSNETNRTRCYSLNRLAINLGWAFGPAIGGLLASKSYSLIFLADGITCMGAGILLYFLFISERKRVKQKIPAAREEVVRSAYKDKPFLAGIALLFIVGFCFFQMFTILPVFYKNDMGFRETTIGWLMAMNGLLIVLIEMVLVYKLENRRSPLSYMIMGSLLIAISFLILNISPVLGIAILSMLVITVGEMLLFPFMNNFWVSRSTESNRGQYAALYTMAFSVAIVTAPTIASQIATRSGFEVLWSVDFIICSFAGLGFYFLKKMMNKHERIQKIHPDPVVGP
jgi:predicted MFS family arabinose efflux permease